MKPLSKLHAEAIEKAKTEQAKVKAAALAMIETPMDMIKSILLKHEEAVIEVMSELHRQQQADEALRLADELDCVAYSITADSRGYTESGDPQNACTDAAAELRRLHAENEALRADAKRYRWLIASHWYVGLEPDGNLEGVSMCDYNVTPRGVSEAIDAAMKEQQ